MEMCYSGALVMPSSYAVMDEEEMMYLEGGMSSRTRTAEERICVASFIAASAVALGRMTVSSFTKLAATACAGILAFFGCISSGALLAATAYESILAGMAANYASKNQNYSYTCYGFGNLSIYTVVNR